MGLCMDDKTVFVIFVRRMVYTQKSRGVIIAWTGVAARDRVRMSLFVQPASPWEHQLPTVTRKCKLGKCKPANQQPLCLRACISDITIGAASMQVWAMWLFWPTASSCHICSIV